MRAVVTAGGTSEPIDDVRVLTNASTGRFGVAIANALAARGAAVTLLLARTASLDGVDPRVRVVRFGGVDELSAAIDAEVADPPGLWFMAAAVSDYRPRRAEGKIRSDAESLTLTLDRAPKLLATLRPRMVDATIVGFKLLSRVSPEELVAVAAEQVRRNGLSATVANDWSRLGGDDHPVFVVRGDGGAVPISGARHHVAAAVVDAVWPPAPVEAGMPRWGGSFRAEDPLTAALPWLRGTWWGPDGIAGDALDVATDWADGSPELAREVLRAVLTAAPAGPGFAVRWPGRRIVAGVVDPNAVEGTFREYAKASGLSAPVALFHGGELAGLWERRGDRAACWVAPGWRGRGVGSAAAAAIDAAGLRAAFPPDDDGFWAERGFLADGTPPSRRTDLVPAASLCLVEPWERRVLLGRRRTPPFEGVWAFPGGRCEPGETALQAAVRELREETGVVVDPVAPARVFRATVGRSPGYRLDAVLLRVGRADPPAVTPELDARWVPLDEALSLRPMAAGTRAVLRSLANGRGG